MPDELPQPPVWDEVEKHEKFSSLTPDQKAQTLQNWVDRVHAYGVAKGSWNPDTEKKLNETVVKKAQSFYSPAPQATQALAATEKPQTFQPIGGEASISPAKTLSGEIQKGNFSEAGSMLYENIRRPLSGLMGPTEKQRFENMVEFGKNEDGSPKYQYKPLGDRMAQESGLFTPFIKQEMMQHDPNDGFLTQVGKASFNTAAGLVGSFLSPAGVMLPAAGDARALFSVPGELSAVSAATGAGSVAAKAVTGLFTSDMLAQVPEQIHRAMTADTTQGKIEGWLGATTSLAMAALGVKHLAKGEKAAAPTREEIKAHLDKQPDEILQVAASDPDFQKSSPDMHAAIVSELDRRGVEPKSAEDIVAIAKTREAAVAAKSAGATETAKELETKMVEIQSAPPPNEQAKPQQVTPVEPAKPPASQQPGLPPDQAGPPPGASPKPGAKPGGEVPTVKTGEYGALNEEEYPVIPVPLSDITLSKDVPNFKEGADPKTGVVEGEQLQGKFKRFPARPIILWKRLNGALEVITGRHRLDLAKRSVEKTIPAQILNEADGFTREEALTLDAESNIQDGNGSVKDYAHYFKNSPQLTEESARQGGLLSRAKGKAGWNLGKNATENLYSIFASGRIEEKAAVEIAKAAPGDEVAQQYGMKLALEGEKPHIISESVKGFAEEKQSLPPAEQTDFFAGTDMDLKFREEAKKVASEKLDLNARLKLLQAGKKSEIADSENIDVKNPESIPNRIKALKGELERWEKWRSHPDLAAKVRGKPAPEAAKLEPQKPKAKKVEEPKEGELPIADETKTAEQVAEEKGKKDQVDAIAEEQNRRLIAPEVEIQQDMLGKESDVPLFDQPKKTETKAPADDWLGATEDLRQEKGPSLSERMKKNLAEKNKTGGINKQILQDLVDYGHRVYEKGMTYAKWSAEMVKQFGKGILNHTQAAWSKIKQVYSEAGISSPKKFTELDRATTERGLRLQRSFADAERVQSEIKKSVPDEKRQGAISVWLEANGDAATLQQWAAGAKGKAFKAAAEAALNLSPAELATATKARGAFDALEAIGNRYDVLGNHRDNYVPHVWEVENKATGVGSSRLQDKFKFAKARTFNNFFEGDQAGFTPKTLAIGKLLPSYLHEMNRVIADREFIRSVSDKTGTDGRPLVIPRGNAQTVDSSEYAVMGSGKRAVSVHETEAEAQAAVRPGERVEKREMSTALVNPRGFAKAETAAGEKIDQHDYKVMGDQPALSGWRWLTSDPNGNSVILKGDLAIHPELVKRLTSTMGKSAIKQWYNEPSKGLAVIPKAIAKNLDTAQSVAKREMFGFLAPFHQVQEGTHAVGHLVNPFYNLPKPDLRDPATGDAVRHGLMVYPEKGSSQNYLEGVGGKGSFPSQIARKFGGKAGEFVAEKVIDGYQDYLFHQYIPALKVKTYAHILERNMDRLKGDIASGKVSEADIKLLSATQTNAAYGHLNYSLMDRNPTMQHLLQLALLAPDFLEARARFVAQALKPSKAGTEQLRAIATLAAVQAASAYTISTLSGGQWDWKDPFAIVIGNRRYHMRSVPADLMQAGGFIGGNEQSTREFVSGRINPVAGKVGQLISGRNYRGEETGAMDTMGEMLTNYIPITLRSMPGLRDLTKTSKNNPLTPLEQLAGSFGLKVSRYSPITKTYEIADKWMEKNGTLKPKGVYPTSKYQGLRYALEDGDMARAKGEYEKLVKSSDASKVAKGFHESIYFPFTGSPANDAKFASELSDGDRLMYEHAMETKKSILEKFNAIPDLQAGAQTEKSAGGSSASDRGSSRSGHSIKRRSR